MTNLYIVHFKDGGYLGMRLNAQKDGRPTKTALDTLIAMNYNAWVNLDTVCKNSINAEWVAKAAGLHV